MVRYIRKYAFVKITNAKLYFAQQSVIADEKSFHRLISLAIVSNNFLNSPKKTKMHGRTNTSSFSSTCPSKPNRSRSSISHASVCPRGAFAPLDKNYVFHKFPSPSARVRVFSRAPPAGQRRVLTEGTRSWPPRILPKRAPHFTVVL